ncbi:MAG: tetratricopeptide repeat protein [Pirellulaceae bacterium]
MNNPLISHRHSLVRKLLTFCLITFTLLFTHAPVLADESAKSEREITTQLNTYLKERRCEEALAYVHQRERSKEFPERIPVWLCSVAHTAYYSDAPETAKKVLLEVVSNYPNAPYIRVAWCQLGNVYHRLGDEKEMLTAFEKGMDGFRPEADKSIAQALANEDFAHEFLGSRYMAARDWDKALACWEHWMPTSFCGTCFDEMDGARKNSIWLCKLQKGNHTDCAREVMQRLRKNAVSPTSGGSFQAFMAYRMYSQAGQKDDLLAVARRAKEKEVALIAKQRRDPLSERDTAASYAGHAVLYCNKLERLSLDHRYQDLIDILSTVEQTNDLTEARRGDWPLRAVAQILARRGAEVVPLIERAIKERDDPSGDAVNWMYYSLARNSSPEARDALSRVELGPYAWNTKVKSLFFAHALNKDADADSLMRFEGSVRNVRLRYGKAIDHGIAWMNVENGWPAPKNGSLRGEFDLGIEPLEELLKK